MTDLKLVYQATSKEVAEDELLNLEKKWGKKYPVVIESWQNNWNTFLSILNMQYAQPIRKLIYTTNTVEGFHRQVRKVTKTKEAFPNDMALLKLVYLATMNIQKKWTSPLQNWSLTIQQLLDLKISSGSIWRPLHRGYPRWSERLDRVQITLPAKLKPNNYLRKRDHMEPIPYSFGF